MLVLSAAGFYAVQSAAHRLGKRWVGRWDGFDTRTKKGWASHVVCECTVRHGGMSGVWTSYPLQPESDASIPTSQDLDQDQPAYLPQSSKPMGSHSPLDVARTTLLNACGPSNADIPRSDDPRHPHHPPGTPVAPVADPRSGSGIRIRPLCGTRPRHQLGILRVGHTRLGEELDHRVRGPWSGVFGGVSVQLRECATMTSGCFG
jgi:hypothetical protein